MKFRVLGPFEVLDDGRPVDIGPRQQRALLALLVINMNRVVSTDRILEDLWHDDVTDKEKTLWVYISRLRTALEPTRRAHAKSSVLITRDHGYELVVDPKDVDAHQFGVEAARGRDLVRDDPAAASAVLEEALELWRGDAYEDFTYYDFARTEIDRLNEARLQASEDLCDAKLRTGLHREVVGDLGGLLRDHPLRERTISLLMVALYRSGRQADALRAFQRYRRAVGEELGIEPSPELCTLEEQILLHDDRLEPQRRHADVSIDAEPKNPYMGLQAFSETDVATFFGRDRLISDMVRRLSAGPLVSLIGASGSGKSSALKAGLIPAVRKGAAGNPEKWRIATMIPGSRPFTELEAALLRSSLDAPDGLTELFDHPDDGLLLAGLRLVPEESGRLLLIIDQFEELFTMVQSKETRDRFIRSLEVALEDAHRRICVVIALRADFYHAPLEYPVFGEMLGESIVNAVPLLPDELEAAAESPAAMARVQFEPRLLAQLIADVAGQGGALPHFQYALTELFDRRRGAVLTLDAYYEMGGVSGAVTQRAEDVYQTLDNQQQAAAKQLFLRLVTINEGSSWSRRRVMASEIINIAADTVDLEAVISEYGGRRLLTFDRDKVTGSPTVEVSHEALLTDWHRLRDWIEQGREDVLRHAHLTSAMAEWSDSGKRDDYLLSGERLEDYERWADESTLQLNTSESQYLEASIAHRDQERDAEAQRIARETKLDRKARRSLVGLFVATALLAVVAVGILIPALGGGPDIALVHGVTGDFGVNDLMINGALTAEREHELSIERVEPLISPEDDLTHIAENGADLIVVSSDFDAQVENVAPDFPEVHFVAVDPALIHAQHPNVTEVHFAVVESAFLAGAAAGLKTNSGVVGFVGGLQTFSSEQSRSGFEQGARFIDPEITVLSRYLGPVDDPLTRANRSPELAHELASALYMEGADVIFHEAGESGAGVLAAAREHEAGNRWVVGSNVDAYLTASSEIDQDYILSSAIKRFDKAVERSVAAFLDGSLEAGDSVIGLPEEGVGLSREGGHLNPVNGQLANLAGDLAFGHVSVHEYSLDPPGWQLAHHLKLDLAMENGSCTADTAGSGIDSDTVRVEPGQVIAVDYVNHSEVVTGIGMDPVPPGTTLQHLDEEALADVRPRSLGAPLALSAAGPGARTGLAAVMPRSPVAITCFILDPYTDDSVSLPAAFPTLIINPEASDE